MIIDNKVLTEPRAWHITKVNRLEVSGLTRITLAQDRFDAHKDFIETNEDGEVIGMWADYYTEGQLIPEDYEQEIVPSGVYMTMTYSGTKPELKVGGSFKKITIHFFIKEEEQHYTGGVWSYALKDGGIITPLDDISEYLVEEVLSSSQIRIKFIGDASNIGKVLIVKNTAMIYGKTYESSVELDIKSL